MKKTFYFYMCVIFFAISINSQRVSRVTPVVRVVKEVGPAVVNISTERIVKRSMPSFDDFFDNFFEVPEYYKTKSLGSGVIISKEGFIVTNAHVVKNATKITVILNNKKKYRAEIIGYSTENDLALIKIESNYNLPFAKWGNSSDIMIGETVIALGNPFGLTNSVTTGVISAQNRSIAIGGKIRYRDFLQTDAAINPGNSGGALLNIYGELIGINTAIISKGQGLGFAIPVNRVRKKLGEILDYKYTRGLWVGLKLIDISSNKNQWKILIREVENNSPAKNSGLKKGDQILELENQKLSCVFDLKKDIFMKNSGDSFRLKIKRKGEIRNIIIKIKEEQNLKILWEKMGILVKEYNKKVIVKNIKENSPADQIGIQEDDLILLLSNYRIQKIKDLIWVLNNIDQSTLLIVIMRKNKKLVGKIEINY